MRKGLKKGFTLIELLVVIAIIAILATVVIINVTGARAKSARAKVGADLSTATRTYAACQSFSGTPATYTAAAVTICGGTAPTDPTELATTVGKWPALSAGFTIVVPSGTTIASVTAPAPAAGATFICTANGCVGSTVAPIW